MKTYGVRVWVFNATFNNISVIATGKNLLRGTLIPELKKKSGNLNTENYLFKMV
jgi:hypothetical protein